MFLNRCFENEMPASDNASTGANQNMMGYAGMQGMNGCSCTPVMECPQERVVHRNICYEVPHVIPINTRIINHHIYRHTYQPCFTCCEENEVCNVYDNHCGM